MRIHLLGTGAAVNECRFQASLLVDAGDAGSLLMDTGSGMDVVRTMTNMGIDPRTIRHIFVSHRHVDHAGGLEPLLLWHASEAHVQNLPVIRIYGEPRTLAALKAMYQAVSTVVPALFGEQLQWVPVCSGQTVDVGDQMRLTPFNVDHLPEDGGALGCLVDVAGKRLAYSGDTRPCASLPDACCKADLLFHEAGGLDERSSWVHMIGHSTGGDAGRAALKGEVGRLVLTHFPDEDLIDPMLAEARQFYKGRVELAQDLGHVDL